MSEFGDVAVTVPAVVAEWSARGSGRRRGAQQSPAAAPAPAALLATVLQVSPLLLFISNPTFFHLCWLGFCRKRSSYSILADCISVATDRRRFFLNTCSDWESLLARSWVVINGETNNKFTRCFGLNTRPGISLCCSCKATFKRSWIKLKFWNFDTFVSYAQIRDWVSAEVEMLRAQATVVGDVDDVLHQLDKQKVLFSDIYFIITCANIFFKAKANLSTRFGRLCPVGAQTTGVYVQYKF